MSNVADRMSKLFCMAKMKVIVDEYRLVTIVQYCEALKMLIIAGTRRLGARIGRAGLLS